MTLGKLLALVGAVLMGVFVLTGTLFPVHQIQQAIVLQLGEPIRFQGCTWTVA